MPNAFRRMPPLGRSAGNWAVTAPPSLRRSRSTPMIRRAAAPAIPTTHAGSVLPVRRKGCAGTAVPTSQLINAASVRSALPTALILRRKSARSRRSLPMSAMDVRTSQSVPSGNGSMIRPTHMKWPTAPFPNPEPASSQARMTSQGSTGSSAPLCGMDSPCIRSTCIMWMT